jgi:hypothetical protein
MDTILVNTIIYFGLGSKETVTGVFFTGYRLVVSLDEKISFFLGKTPTSVLRSPEATREDPRT